VRRRQNHDSLLRIESVHLREQLIERLLTLVASAQDRRRAARFAERVQLVNENDARRGSLGLLEQIANAGRADADEHFDEIGSGQTEEWNLRFAGDGSGEQRLAGSRSADEENALRNLSA